MAGRGIRSALGIKGAAVAGNPYFSRMPAIVPSAVSAAIASSTAVRRKVWSESISAPTPRVVGGSGFGSIT